MKGRRKAERLSQPDMARARALIKAMGYDSEDLQFEG